MTKRFEYYAYISFTYLHIEAFVETFLKKAGFSTRAFMARKEAKYYVGGEVLELTDINTLKGSAWLVDKVNMIDTFN